MTVVRKKHDDSDHAEAQRFSHEIKELRARLQECEDTLAAIRGGGVDAIVISGSGHEQVFTLAGTENAYRVFVEAMDEGAITVNASGVILYANKAFANLIAKRLENLIGTSVFDIISASDKGIFEAVFREARNHSGGRCELTLTRGSGEQVPVFVSARSCIEFGAKAICMVLTDLSDQKRNEKIVADGKLARLILNNAAEPMAVCDSVGIVLHCNPAFHTLCAENPLLRPFDEVIRLEVATDDSNARKDRAWLFRVRDALNGREFRGTEVCLRQRGGDSIHLLLSTSPLLVPNMERAGLLITLFNIEERRRTENALRRSEKLAATGRLAASIAHEINNPLAALTNLVYLIETESNSDTVRSYAHTAQEELARVAHITRQTLAFYRESTSPTNINLAELIDSAIFLYASAIRNKNIEVRRELEFAGTIHGYANELRQVFSNIIGNAVEAMPAGGTLCIRTYQSQEWCNSRKPGVRIVIGDTGEGIKSHHRARLFEPFFTTKAEKGTGLGLWVSQGIVEKHGGFIRMKSSTGQERHGTVFSVFLPQHDEVGQKRQAVA
ncbi:MAG TPA: ATP-binding protein [Terriglobales bacterium]|nr:ATP-binding protein [Terriglobales bacterium]